MPSNPIQRKTRNAFLLGMLIMLVIAIIIFAILYFTMFAETLEGTKVTGETMTVYVLAGDVKSGEEITSSKVTIAKVSINTVPSNYLTDTEGLNNKKYKSKVDLQAGTILSDTLVYQEEKLANSARLMEYNMLTLPSTLKIGDYIDVRFTVPSGQNYIVLSKKQVMNIQNKTITLYLTEDEILMMSSAIIESYVMTASDLSVVQYLEAGMQGASTPTYSVSSEVYQLIQANSQKGVNIEDYGKINDSYNNDLRAIIDQELGQYVGSELTNIQTGVEAQREEAMNLYLSGLQGY